MGKYTKLLINRELIDIHIGEYFIENGGEYEIEGPKVLNEGIGQNRYTLKIEGKEAMLDFFFRNSDGTTTIKPTGNEFSKEIGTKIADYIVEANNCCNIKKGVVTLENITQNQFDELKNYLASIEGVEVLAEDNDANGCGQLWKIKSQIGDKITLTYYKKSGKLVSQGYMFKLFLEVTSFLTGLGLKFEKEVNDKNNDDVELLVKKLLPNAYDKLDRVLIDFIYDSCSHINLRIECKDYSNWTFSALKGLEAFIKQILLKNSIRLWGTKGFAIRGPKGESLPIFINGPKYEVNTEVVSVDSKSKLALEEAYIHYHANRHRLFHTKQGLKATESARLINQSEAEKIVYKVCDLFDKYHYIII
ncbi:MAG: type II toxin-antitoxin system RnlA family toxin [Clostridium perfringens]|nr:type II toxin-antitoxin system RnlA family toxin [Clostridium perfringens]MDU4830125.1 type II toxin-antitoxin system RnlA family toxin [Clostridium perfringens]